MSSTYTCALLLALADDISCNHLDGKIDFACFLDILHEHQRKGDPIKEVLMAFRSHDRQRKGVIPAKELRAILTGMGERMAPQESMDRRLIVF